MKKGKVTVGILGVLSTAAMLACGGDARTQTKHCADKNGIIVSQEECEKEEDRRRHAGSGYMPLYHWFYLPGRTYYAPGTNVSSIQGASREPIPGKSISTPRRGGFGSTGRAFSPAT